VTIIVHRRWRHDGHLVIIYAWTAGASGLWDQLRPVVRFALPEHQDYRTTERACGCVTIGWRQLQEDQGRRLLVDTR